ncbi:MAG TPA: ECF transporter S component [Clostridia bacterium]|jgi:uncharacterized membrane protein|nr:ECF transporter S component [Clostridia bacterium]
METRHEPAVNTQSFGKKVHPAVIAVWAAFIAIAQMLPVIPVFGTGATFGLSDSVVVLSGILFGPWAGALASAIGGFLGQIIAPHGAVFGVVTFICPALAAMVAGLLMKKKWPHVIGIFAILGLAWFAFPLGRTAWFQPVVNYTPSILLAYPAATWGVNLIRSQDFKKMFVGITLLCTIGGCASLAIGNTMALPMFALPRELWLAVLPISVPQRILFAILAAVIGVPLLIGLPKIGVTVGTKLLDDNN